MVGHKEMPEEGNLQLVVFLERQDMNLLKLKKVLTKSILLMDKLFKINRIPEPEMKIMTVNLSLKIQHRKNQEVECQKTDLKKYLKI